MNWSSSSDSYRLSRQRSQSAAARPEGDFSQRNETRTQRDQRWNRQSKELYPNLTLFQAGEWLETFLGSNSVNTELVPTTDNVYCQRGGWLYAAFYFKQCAVSLMLFRGGEHIPSTLSVPVCLTGSGRGGTLLFSSTPRNRTFSFHEREGPRSKLSVNLLSQKWWFRRRWKTPPLTKKDRIEAQLWNLEAFRSQGCN